jgi:hypothetical protein
MESESCRVCGGDGRIANSFGGSEKTCPSCRGSGRRSVEPLFRDVTKTKESHHLPTNRAARVEKPIWPSSPDGVLLATEVRGSRLPDDTKSRLIREIIEYEASHGHCTKTFLRKVKKELH